MKNANSKLIGNHGEEIAESTLRGLGLEMVEKIATPVFLTAYFDIFGKLVRGVFRVKYGERVSGDRRAIIPGAGTSVLIEVKSYWDGNLPYAKLKPHQHQALRTHAGYGGLSLLVWVHHSGVYVMEYPEDGIEGFKPRSSLSSQKAESIHYSTVNLIYDKIHGEERELRR